LLGRGGGTLLKGEDILFRRNKEKTAKLQGMTFAYFFVICFVLQEVWSNQVLFMQNYT